MISAQVLDSFRLLMRMIACPVSSAGDLHHHHHQQTPLSSIGLIMSVHKYSPPPPSPLPQPPPPVLPRANLFLCPLNYTSHGARRVFDRDELTHFNPVRVPVEERDREQEGGLKGSISLCDCMRACVCVPALTGNGGQKDGCFD